MKRSSQILKNILISVLILFLAYLTCFFLHRFQISVMLIPTIFVLAVFLISLLTSGYSYGIAASVCSMLLVNFAFTVPFFDFNFTIPENILSAVILIAVTLLTGALTIQNRKQNELKRESEMEKMRANLLRAVSHDLRTPLTTIYGSSTAILENYDRLSDEQKKEMIRSISEDAQWLTHMVENLLSVTRINTSGVQLIKMPTVVDELIDSLVSAFRKRYPDRELLLDLPDEILIVPMDPTLIQQVLFNILENAVEHAEGMTELRLLVARSGKRAVFKISDNGCGIPRARLSTLFTGSYSMNEEASDNVRNKGIGLSVCQTIVKAHGGEIYAANRPSGGAIFTVILDLCEDEAEEI